MRSKDAKQDDGAEKLEANNYFYILSLMSKEAGKRMLDFNQNAVNSTLAVMAAQPEQVAPDVLTKACSLRLVQPLIELYIWFSILVLKC